MIRLSDPSGRRGYGSVEAAGIPLMRFSADAVMTLITIFLIARKHKLVDPQALEPLLRSVVEHGQSENFKAMLSDLIVMIERIEAE